MSARDAAAASTRNSGYDENARRSPDSFGEIERRARGQDKK
jgi:hypothetical protein